MIFNCNEENFSYFANPNPFVLKRVIPFSFINDLNCLENPFKHKSPPPGFSSDLNGLAKPFKPSSLTVQEFLQYFPIKKVPSITFSDLEEEIYNTVKEVPDQYLRHVPGKTMYRGK